MDTLAATFEKHDYKPEAVALMLEELKKRGVSEEGVAEAAVAAPPPLLNDSLPERDTWLFPARLNRRRYLVRSLVSLVALIAVAVVIEFFPGLQPGSFIALLVVSFIYAVIGLFIPRSRDAGLSSKLAFIFVLIPITAFGMSAYLFFAPSKK